MKRLMTCGTCKEVKSEDLFVKNGRSKEGERGRCKQCKSEVDKKYRESHKKEVADYFAKLWRTDPTRKIKNRIIKEKATTGMNATEFVKDKVCEICGMNDIEHHKKYNERLHIHHEDNNGQHNIRKHIKPIHENLKVLCRSCHVSVDNGNRDYNGRGYKIWETRRKNEND